MHFTCMNNGLIMLYTMQIIYKKKEKDNERNFLSQAAPSVCHVDSMFSLAYRAERLWNRTGYYVITRKFFIFLGKHSEQFHGFLESVIQRRIIRNTHYSYSNLQRCKRITRHQCSYYICSF